MKVVFVVVPFTEGKDADKATRTVVTGLPVLKVPKFVQHFRLFRSAIAGITYKNLGLGYIATNLKRQNHTVSLIDGQAMGVSLEEAFDLLREESPDLIAIPNFVGGRFFVYKLVRQISRAMPGVPVVLGGPQVTLYPELVFEECPELCTALRGEADFTLAELATRMEAGMPADTIPGIVVRTESGRLFYGPPPEIIQNLDSIPFPDREIYSQDLYNPIPMMLTFPAVKAEQIISSRGCDWHSCRFCYQSIPGMTCYRRRSPENVVEELRMLVDQLWRSDISISGQDTSSVYYGPPKTRAYGRHFWQRFGWVFM